MSAKQLCLVTALLAVCAIGTVSAQGEPLAPHGWWNSLQAGGAGYPINTWCVLRDFPPIGGEAARFINCKKGQTYDNEFLFRLVEVNANLNDTTTVTTSKRYLLRTFNTQRSYAWYKPRNKGIVEGGVAYDKATLFTVEKANGGTGNVNLASDSFFLKADGTRYCRINGNGHSALLYCDTSNKANALPFKMSYASFHGASITSQSTNKACGAHAVGFDNTPHYFNCTGTPRVGAGDYVTNFTLALKTPGKAELLSGTGVAFKSYSTFYRYLLSTMAANKDAPYYVDFDYERSMNDYQWMTIEKYNAAVGTPLKSGDTITIKNIKLNAYCCVSSGPEAQIRCSKTSVGNQDDSCRYTISW